MDTEHSPTDLQNWKRLASPWTAGSIFTVTLVAIHIAIASIGWNNPILDQFGFRQTQSLDLASANWDSLVTFS
jgi:hypothetical protein